MNYKDKLSKLNLEDLKKRYRKSIASSNKRNWEIWLAVAAGLIVGVIMIRMILH
jgi:hypothetical protein